MRNIITVNFFLIVLFAVFCISPLTSAGAINYEALVNEMPSESVIERIKAIPDPKLVRIIFSHGAPQETEYKNLQEFLPDVALQFNGSFPASYEIDRMNKYTPPRTISVNMSPPTPFEVKGLNRMNSGTRFILVSPVYHYAYEVRTFNSLTMEREVQFTFPMYPSRDQLNDISGLIDTPMTFIMEFYPDLSHTSILNNLKRPVDLVILTIYPDDAKVSQLRTLKPFRSLTIKAERLPREHEVEIIKSVPGEFSLVLYRVLSNLSITVVERLNRIDNLKHITFRTGRSDINENILKLLQKLKMDITIQAEIQ